MAARPRPAAPRKIHKAGAGARRFFGRLRQKSFTLATVQTIDAGGSPALGCWGKGRDKITL
jgi:hypothetical protein